jgi:hypothetical protein
VLEEVGLNVSVGRLLAVQHLEAEGEKPSSVQFVFDSKPVVGLPCSPCSRMRSPTPSGSTRRRLLLATAPVVRLGCVRRSPRTWVDRLRSSTLRERAE